MPGQSWQVDVLVTADFQGSDELDGFFLQDPTGDGVLATSDGVFVYAPDAADVAVGDLVRVRGTVATATVTVPRSKGKK